MALYLLAGALIGVAGLVVIPALEVLLADVFRAVRERRS